MVKRSVNVGEFWSANVSKKKKLIDKKGNTGSAAEKASCSTSVLSNSENEITTTAFSPRHISDTKGALAYFKNAFPATKFPNSFPTILFKHQLYSFISNRTAADKQVNCLCQEGEIRILRIGPFDVDDMLVSSDEYINFLHLLANSGSSNISSRLVDRFIALLKLHPGDIFFTKKHLTDAKFSEQDITGLMQFGCLTIDSVSKWAISIPNLAIFIKAFQVGRQHAILAIKRSKHREILLSELEKRRLPQKALLGMQFHIHDLIGADLVTRTETTSGPLLRLRCHNIPTDRLSLYKH